MKPVTVKRRMKLSGATIRVELEPLPGERVRVVRYWVKRKGSQMFRRCKAEEGRDHSYKQLNLKPNFTDLFGEG